MQNAEILQHLQQAEKMKTNEYGPEIIEALHIAAKSGVAELYNAAVTALVIAMRPYQNNFLIRNYSLYKSSDEYEDYISVLNAAILKDLRNWDPEKGQLSTYFEPRFKKACVRYKMESRSTLSSPHYEAVFADIKRARAELEQHGITNPTPIQLRNEIALHKRPHSVQTIIKCLEQVKEIQSLEASGDMVDRTSANPVDYVIQNEECEQIQAVISEMEPQYAMVMNIYYQMYLDGATESDKMSNERMRSMLMDYMGPVSDEWVRNITQSARRDFRRRVKKKKLYEPKRRTDFHSFNTKDDDEELKEALRNDTDALFSEND